MFRPVLMLSGLAVAGLVSVSPAGAASQSVMKCVLFTENANATEGQYLGWIENDCPFPIAVVHDFGLNPDRTPKQGEWCAGRVHHEASLQDADLLDPAESIGVGWGLNGVATDIFWAACSVDTSANNSVNFLMQEPQFRFFPNCNYECE